ncbi:hypothetical protein BKA59DRAFT_106124 [Fusarium tricinctum]|uniref:Uncharacterized protein n=1 Tax=Fusarium tricinctum TaxID=61284 RepID=A0A8K0S9Z5_9HYPO|nr:hypothetical protein BKA59DRAFT_106124 [Fusarium tricinctum]
MRSSRHAPNQAQCSFLHYLPFLTDYFSSTNRLIVVLHLAETTTIDLFHPSLRPFRIKSTQLQCCRVEGLFPPSPSLYLFHLLDKLFPFLTSLQLFSHQLHQLPCILFSVFLPLLGEKKAINLHLYPFFLSHMHERTRSCPRQADAHHYPPQLNTFCSICVRAHLGPNACVQSGTGVEEKKSVISQYPYRHPPSYDHTTISPLSPETQIHPI